MLMMRMMSGQRTARRLHTMTAAASPRMKRKIYHDRVKVRPALLKPRLVLGMLHRSAHSFLEDVHCLNLHRHCHNARIRSVNQASLQHSSTGVPSLAVLHSYLPSSASSSMRLCRCVHAQTAHA